MLTKADFKKAIDDLIAQYPAIAPLYYAGDPRITQHLDAMATMLAMYSAQLEVSLAEPFEKTRDTTVLADAALRGIIPKATPARVRITARNTGLSQYVIATGRTIFDGAGYPYRIETSATIPAGGSATFEAVQVREIKSVINNTDVFGINHTVTNSIPFYSIEIPASDSGDYLSAISVTDGIGEYSYRYRYVNSFPGDRIYHVEVDEKQRVYVRFGFDGVVGFQPIDGQVINLRISYSAGDIKAAAGSQFSFDYLLSPADSEIELTMNATLIAGQNPISLSTLRDLARYPSVYDVDAVFLGEFDFLVRRNFQSLQFLSVWNEQAEELARGANINNINTLFVACLSATGEEVTQTEPNPGIPVAPIEITALTSTQTSIKQAILNADDSYRIKFFTPVRSFINVSINATISSVYSSFEIEQKIKDIMIAEYGESAALMRKSKVKILYQQVYSLLRAQIPALAQGGADLAISITEPVGLINRPEVWRYVTLSSMVVSVISINTSAQSWGG